MNVAIYARVSTFDQSNQRQTSELKKICSDRNWTVIETITEKISGAAANQDRVGLIKVLELAAKGQIKKVVIHEMSRLGRKVSEVISTMETLKDCGVSIFIANIATETLLPNGKENHMIKPILLTLAGFAEMERELSRERIISGIKSKKLQNPNYQHGRKKGSTENEMKFLSKHRPTVKWLKAGKSIRHTAKIAGVSDKTVQKVKKVLVEKGEL